MENKFNIEPIFEKFCKEARKYRVNVIRSQMIVSAFNYTAKIFNKISYVEIRQNCKSTIIKNDTDILNYLTNIKNDKFMFKNK